MAVPPKIKDRITICSSNSSSGQMHKESKAGICRLVFIEYYPPSPKKWKQSKCLSTDAQIRRMWYVLTREYYAVSKRKEIPKCATMCRSPEGMTLSEINQTQNDQFYRSLLGRGT